MAQVKGGATMSGSTVHNAHAKAVLKERSRRSLSQKNILAFVSDMEQWHLRRYSVPQRRCRMVLGRVGRCLAYSVSTKKFPPRSWGRSDLRKEWSVLQEYLRNWDNGTKHEK